MTTTRPRHQVTETDELAAALDEAAARWPQLSRGQLITRLALEGHRVALVRQHQHRNDRLEALRRHSGVLTGVYPGHLGDLREVKMPDCCVLLSALDHQARLASFDDRLIKAAEARGVPIAAG